MDKIKVLIVDDHAIMRDGIKALLNVHDDIEIVGEASEGKEANAPYNIRNLMTAVLYSCLQPAGLPPGKSVIS